MTEIKPTVKGYNLSKDYDKLWELIQAKHRVAAWVDVTKEGDEEKKYNIVEVKSFYRYQIGTRGIGYEGFENTFEEFKESCINRDLSYIPPKY